ncbi:MAG TPA: hypothetical protein PL060_01295, partial [bacterium]|nr:hypothetical protein [bacterium]
MLPEKLVLLTAIVRRHKASSVLAKLMSTGFFHPVDAAGLSGSTENIQPLKQGFESARWKEIISRYHYITQQTHFVPSYSDVPASYIEAETSLQEIQENLNGFFEKKEEILKEISRLQPLIEKNPIYLPVPTAENFTFIHSEIGEIFPDKSMVLETLLSGIPHVVIPGEIRNNRLIIGIIILKKDIATFERVKKEIDWSSISSDISITDIPVEQYRKKIEELKAELMIVDSRIQEIVQKYAGVLSKISVSIEIYEKLVQTKKLTVMTNMTMFLSGWIPEKESQSVSELIQKTDP